MISESQVERLYIAKLYQDEEDRRDEIHVTDLTDQCPRRVWFEKRSPWPEGIDGIIRMAEGKLLHKLELLAQSELEIEYQGIKGRVDEYENGILIEKKFVDFVPNNIAEVQKYYNHYVEQVGFYAYMLVNLGYEFKQAFLLFVKRGEQNERGRRPLKAFDVTSLIDLNKIEAEFHGRKNNIKAMLDKGEPPEIPPTFSAFDYPCSYCKYAPRCYSSGVTQVSDNVRRV
jgi:CRISPR/Cas system-associated exonuclease Cas4 (RecB family)